MALVILIANGLLPHICEIAICCLAWSIRTRNLIDLMLLGTHDRVRQLICFTAILRGANRFSHRMCVEMKPLVIDLEVYFFQMTSNTKNDKCFLAFVLGHAFGSIVLEETFWTFTMLLTNLSTNLWTCSLHEGTCPFRGASNKACVSHFVSGADEWVIGGCWWSIDGCWWSIDYDWLGLNWKWEEFKSNNEFSK